MPSLNEVRGLRRKVLSERDLGFGSFGVEAEVVTSDNVDSIVAALEANGLSASQEGYNHEDRPYWKLVPDSSIEPYDMGTELVSPVLRLDKPSDLRDMHLAFDALTSAGVSINRTCGLHVHHDARRLSLEGIGIAMQAYKVFSPIVDKLVASYRAGAGTTYSYEMNDYSDWVAEVLDHGRDALFEGCPGYVQRGDSEPHAYNRMPRYRHVNGLALAAHGTLEYRQHQATREAKRVMAWVELTGAFTWAGKYGITRQSLKHYQQLVDDETFGLEDMLNLLHVPSLAREYYLSGEYAEGDIYQSEYDPPEGEDRNYCYSCGAPAHDPECGYCDECCDADGGYY